MGTEERSIRSALNQLAPLHRIRTVEMTKGTDDDTISDIQVRLSGIARKHAAVLCQTIDIGGGDATWAESYFSSLVCSLIADAWVESPTDAEQFDYSAHLASLATEPMYAGLPASWHDSSAEVSYVATTLSAIARAMQSYAKFNLFHFDRDKVQNFFTETIITNAQTAVVSVMENMSEQPDTNSASSLLQSVIRQSGVIMSDIWQTASLEFIKLYQSASAEQKASLNAPYALDFLAAQHLKSMQVLSDNVVFSLQAANGLKASPALNN